MTAAEVLAAHQWRGESLGCGCRWNWPEERTYFCGEEERIEKAHVVHQLDALKAAGYAVVELPKWTQHVPPSDEHNEDGRYEWNTGADLVSAYVSPPEVFIESQEMSPGRARGLAAVLLAAADVAEANHG